MVCLWSEVSWSACIFPYWVWQFHPTVTMSGIPKSRWHRGTCLHMRGIPEQVWTQGQPLCVAGHGLFVFPLVDHVPELSPFLCRWRNVLNKVTHTLTLLGNFKILSQHCGVKWILEFILTAVEKRGCFYRRLKRLFVTLTIQETFWKGAPLLRQIFCRI